MAFRRCADDGPTLNTGLTAAIFQGIGTYIARKPYIFVIFQGGPDPLSPLWIRICDHLADIRHQQKHTDKNLKRYKTPHTKFVGGITARLVIIGIFCSTRNI